MRFRVLFLLAVASFLLLSVAGVVQAVNQPPVADPNGPYNGYVGFPVNFDGTGSSDPDGDPISYDWDFGDGNTGTGPTPSHTYAAMGVYTVTLIVTDSGGLSDSETTTATIGNMPPVADADGPYSGTVGVPVTLDGSLSYDPDGFIINWEWDLDNDGEFDDATGVTATVTFSSVGTYSVGLRVTDEPGDTDTDYELVTIGEQAFVTAHKWNDVNRNKVQDAGEEDIEGWLIEIYRSEDGGATWTSVATGSTGSDGAVTFGLPAPMLYKIVEEELTNWTPTITNFYTVNAESGASYAFEFGNAYEPTGVPEFSLALPILTSLAAALYLVIRKRIGKKLE